MFDTIAKTYLTGVNAPQGAASGSWYNSQGYDASNPLASLNPISGMKYVPASSFSQSFGDSGDVQQVNDGAYMLSSNGTRLPVTQNADGTLSFNDTYDDPAGKTGHDKLGVSYTFDPKTGVSTPTSAGHKYQGGEWVNTWRDAATTLGAVLAAGAGGAALAGSGAGGAGAGVGLGTTGSAATGNMALIESGLGTAGYGGAGAAGTTGGLAAGGAGAAGGGLVTSGNVGGALVGSGAENSVAAQVGQQLGADSLAGSAPAYGGVGTSGAGAGTDAIIGADGLVSAAPAAGAGSASGSSPGFLNSLVSGNYGDAATAAGNWATSANGLQTLGGLASSYLQSNAASNALNAQKDATSQSNALQKYMYDTNRADWAPYRALGEQGTKGYSNLLANPSSITSDPGYQFGLNQGQTAIDRSAASKGSIYSGATLKALDRYGQDYGGTKLNDALGRYSTAAQLGATGTSGTQASGTNYANMTGNNTTGLGNATAGNALLQGNIYSNALNGAISAYKSYNQP